MTAEMEMVVRAFDAGLVQTANRMHHLPDLTAAELADASFELPLDKTPEFLDSLQPLFGHEFDVLELAALAGSYTAYRQVTRDPCEGLDPVEAVLASRQRVDGSGVQRLQALTAEIRSRIEARDSTALPAATGTN